MKHIAEQFELNIQNDKLKTYEVSLWPNNQPPILIGYLKSISKEKLLKEVCKEYNLKPGGLSIVEDCDDTPIKRWDKHI